MNVQEMETARRLNSDIVAMVWEDNAYGLIAWKQTNQFGRHTDLSFSNPDWHRLAEAFGWNGHVVENYTELGFSALCQQHFPTPLHQRKMLPK